MNQSISNILSAQFGLCYSNNQLSPSYVHKELGFEFQFYTEDMEYKFKKERRLFLLQQALSEKTYLVSQGKSKDMYTQPYPYATCRITIGM